MSTYKDVFAEIPVIPHAQQLSIKAYIGQGSSQFCCVDRQFHRHAFYEIAWVSHGASSYVVDFQRYQVPARSLVFISPGQVHQWHDIREKSQLTVVGFLPELFAIDLTDVQKTLIDLPFFVEDAAPVYTVSKELAPIFDQHFKTAVDRAYVDPSQSETLIRAYLNLILIEAQNTLANHPAPKVTDQPAPIRLTRRFRLSVEKHFLQRIQVQDYADQLGVTTNHLVETVRQTAGRTPKRIIQDRLLLEAKRLLAYSTLSAAEIGNELSFPNSSQFGRWFRTNEGVAPGRFRQQVLQ
ncbi:MAG: helix-turn-helix transcriptional regulator [Chloroflexota bacterium]